MFKLLSAVTLLLIAMLYAVPHAVEARDRKPFAMPDVDLELVLAVDVSLSMDIDEQRHQREGYVAAFQSSEIVGAIKSGGLGRIAVTYVEWAGAGSQSVVVPWRRIDGEQSAAAFAEELKRQPISRARMTSISGVLLKAAALFDGNGITGSRRVIDVSGDGPNNDGFRVDQTRDEVIRRGITINGLPLMFKRPDGPYSYFDLADLDRYYAACVIGGPNAFIIAVQDRRKFADAIKRKLVLEIADATPHGPSPNLLRKTQFLLKPKPPTYDCLIGEKRWEQYQIDQW